MVNPDRLALYLSDYPERRISFNSFILLKADITSWFLFSSINLSSSIRALMAGMRSFKIWYFCKILIRKFNIFYHVFLFTSLLETRLLRSSGFDGKAENFWKSITVSKKMTARMFLFKRMKKFSRRAITNWRLLWGNSLFYPFLERFDWLLWQTKGA